MKRSNYGISQRKVNVTQETAKVLAGRIGDQLNTALENLEAGNTLYAKTCLRGALKYLDELRSLL